MAWGGGKGEGCQLNQKKKPHPRCAMQSTYSSNTYTPRMHNPSLLTFLTAPLIHVDALYTTRRGAYRSVGGTARNAYENRVRERLRS